MGNPTSWAVVAVVAYLLGSIPSGVIISRAMSQHDVRYFGSTHTGGRNVMRAAGAWAGAFTTVSDAAKGIVAVAIARWMGTGAVGLAIAATLAVVGHCWPIYTRFHGGMGLATAGGILFWLAPDVLIALIVAWVLLNSFLLRHPARSIGVTVILLPFIVFLLRKPPGLMATGLVVGFVIFIRYRPEFARVYR
jgi:glycerol-3-phosphate acyltransferase PlsY